jgi:CBS domain-containing protein
MQTKEVMSRAPITATWGESLQSAFDKMQRASIRHLPVLDDRGTLIGIISNRDLQRAMEIVESAEDVFPKAVFDEDKFVGDFMSSPVETVALDTPIGDVARRMIAKKISALVVISNQRMVGIITHQDLLHVLIELLEDHTELSSFRRFAYASPVGDLIGFLSRVGI